MSFEFDISDELKLIIRRLAKRDPQRAIILNKKIREIIGNDDSGIDRYKNLRYDLKDYKRAHIDKSFVLIFKVDKARGVILFDRLKHHDDAYA